MPYLVGVVGLILFWIILRLATGSKTSSIIIGEDGAPSTSKAQLAAWTAVVVFSYLALYAVRIRMGDFAALPSVPQNVLIALGISGATAVAAKAIAVNAAANPVTNALPNATETPDGQGQLSSNSSGILLDDSGKPDIGKVQVVIWTIIALGVYLVTVGHAIHKGTPDLPDIDTTLMILMGLGHSIYIGKKVAES
jgi:hypothetical protein